jgi:hypothetical protein
MYYIKNIPEKERLIANEFFLQAQKEYTKWLMQINMDFLNHN